MLTFKSFQNVVCVVMAIGAVACANTGTSGGGPTTTTDTKTVGGTDTTTGCGTDTTTVGVSDTTAGGGTDTAAGTEQTIAQIQSAATSAQCTDESKILNTQNGVTIHSAIVTSGLRLSTTKAGKKLEGLFIQDKGGGVNSGIYLSEDAPGPLADLKIGDVITVTGDVKEFYCYTEMEPAAVIKDGTTELPTAATIDTAVIGATAALADKEAYEGVLVSLQGVVVADNAVLGTDGKPHQIAVGKDQTDKAVLIGNGFYNYMQDKTGAPNYTVGQKLNITGFVEYSFSAYIVTPLTVEVVK